MWIFLISGQVLPAVRAADFGHTDELCGMRYDATFRGTSARSLLSVEALRRAEEDASASASAVGLAQRASASAQATAMTPEDEAQAADRKENHGKADGVQWIYKSLFNACNDG